jgi:Firmicute plasmid replication protein (RepL)
MEHDNSKPIATLSRRGSIKHMTNPFVSSASSNTSNSYKRVSTKGDQMMVVSQNTGEIIAPAGFWQAQEVDKTQFVKLYINGVKAFAELSGSGTKMFSFLYTRIQENIGKDVIYLNFQDVDQLITPLSKATFMRGMKELLDKDFIAETMVVGRYFLNPDFMWNGDRLAFVKEYRLKKTTVSKDTQTLPMFS